MLYQANFAVFCAQYLPKWQNQMDPVTLAFMERGAKFTLADFRNAQFARTALFRKIQSLLERYDFLVTPTNSRTALDVTHDAANDEVVVDGVKCGITRQGWTSYQYPFNLTGHPALALPSRASAPTACRRRSRSSANGAPRPTCCGWARSSSGRGRGRSIGRRRCSLVRPVR